MEWIWLLSPLLSDTFSPATTPNQNRYNNIDSCLFKWSYPCLFKVSPTNHCKCKERRIAFLNQIESTHSTILFFCTWWSNMKCEGGCCSGGRFEETETGWGAASVGITSQLCTTSTVSTQHLCHPPSHPQHLWPWSGSMTTRSSCH